MIYLGAKITVIIIVIIAVVVLGAVIMGQQGSKGRTVPVRADLVRESKIGFGSFKRGTLGVYGCFFIPTGNVIFFRSRISFGHDLKHNETHKYVFRSISICVFV